jgi:UDP-glucose 4-epimerase
MAGSGVHLVTGGAGFIGSHLVAALLSQGRTVRVVDNFLTGRRANLAGALERIELIEADLSEPAAAERACAGVEVVFHTAALPSIPRSLQAPAESIRHGLIATANVLAAARAAGCRRVVYSSSSSIYGGVEQGARRESDPSVPRSPYAAVKLCGEILCRSFSASLNLDTVCLRYFNVYGPRQPAPEAYPAVIPAFLSRMLAGLPPVIFGDGRQSRDFTYVADAVSANIAAADCPGPLGGEAINVGTGRSRNLLEVVALLNRILATNFVPEHRAERPGDVRRSLADVSRAGELLGYRPQTSLEEGLSRTAAAFRSAAGG